MDRISVEDGRVTLADARSGGTLTLEKLTFRGELRSLAGPAKGDGAFVVAGEPYAYRLSTNRPAADGAVRVHLAVDTADQPRLADIDGSVWTRTRRSALRRQPAMGPRLRTFERRRAVSRDRPCAGHQRRGGRGQGRAAIRARGPRGAAPWRCHSDARPEARARRDAGGDPDRSRPARHAARGGAPQASCGAAQPRRALVVAAAVSDPGAARHRRRRRDPCRCEPAAPERRFPRRRGRLDPRYPHLPRPRRDPDAARRPPRRHARGGRLRRSGAYRSERPARPRLLAHRPQRRPCDHRSVPRRRRGPRRPGELRHRPSQGRARPRLARRPLRLPLARHRPPGPDRGRVERAGDRFRQGLWTGPGHARRDPRRRPVRMAAGRHARAQCRAFVGRRRRRSRDRHRPALRRPHARHRAARRRRSRRREHRGQGQHRPERAVRRRAT